MSFGMSSVASKVVSDDDGPLTMVGRIPGQEPPGAVDMRVTSAPFSAVPVSVRVTALSFAQLATVSLPAGHFTVGGPLSASLGGLKSNASGALVVTDLSAAVLVTVTVCAGRR